MLLIWGMSLWFKDIITEASYLGAHTDKVQKGISLGVVLFIVSEVFFFLSIFWAYFHSVRDKCILNLYRKRRYNYFSNYNYSNKVKLKGKPKVEQSIFVKMDIRLKSLIIWSFTTNVSMVKTRLSEVYYPLLPKVGDSLRDNGTISFLMELRNGFIRGEKYTRHSTRMLKDKSELPKETYKIRKAIVGLPKGRNSYGNRVIIVPNLIESRWLLLKNNSKGRITVNSMTLFKHYSTGGTENEISEIMNKLSSLYNFSKNNPNSVIDRKLYSLVYNVDMLKLAYENLKSKPGNAYH